MHFALSRLLYLSNEPHLRQRTREDNDAKAETYT